MTDSILDSVKKVLGLDAAYTAFDPDLVMHINSAISTLTQLGIGPDTGFSITGKDETWATFLGTDARLNSVKSCLYLRVRMLFDPPNTSYMIEAMNNQIREFEWRLNTYREGNSWTDPLAPS